MDKYEYNLKLEEITKLADQGYYEDAADIIDTIDWRRVRNVRTLCMISEIYEEVGRLQDSKALLLRAYRKSQAVRSILFHLTEISVNCGSLMMQRNFTVNLLKQHRTTIHVIL